MHDINRILRDLISTCRDSEDGFGKAAKGVHSDNLRHRFTAIAKQRSDFAGVLSARLQELGDEAPLTGHESGIQHRGWRELETRIRPKDDASFLAECETGEENTRRHYEQALGRDLPPKIRVLLEQQKLAVEEALLELRTVEQVRRAG